MIKDNEIDLTEYRDFGENFNIITRNVRGKTFSNIKQHIESVFYKKMFGKFPWEVVPLAKQNSYKYDGLVALGNAQQRKETIEAQNWGTINNSVCDCCGKEYVKILWNQDWGLCQKCNREMTKINFLPWE